MRDQKKEARYLVIGIGLGAVAGLIFDNLAIGIAAGAALGLAASTVVRGKGG